MNRAFGLVLSALVGLAVLAASMVAQHVVNRKPTAQIYGPSYEFKRTLVP